MGFLRGLRAAAAIGAAIVATGCGAAATPPVASIPAPKTDLPAIVRVQVREAGSTVVRAVPLDDYVAAAVLSEFDPASGDEQAIGDMYEVQAIVARTYAVAHAARHAADGFDLCSTTHCQLYEPARLRTSRWASLARDATARTAGRVLWYANAPAEAVYHADCGGWRSSATAVWGGAAAAYLSGGADDGPAAGAHVDWTFDRPATAVRDALNADPRTLVGGTFDQLQVVERDGAGRAARVVIRGTRDVTVRGEVLRDVLSRAFGPKSVRSTLFTVTRADGHIVMAGRGFGHGVGLCQVGAFARLKAGATPEGVLAFYYPGTRLRR